MTRAWLMLVALGACGRVEFDALADGAVADAGDAAAACPVITHDEDGDLRDDGCDVCPHVSDPAQLDGDGDGVGDACDPEPDIARQQIILFDPFVTLDPAWEISNDERTENDSLVFDAINVSRTVRRPYTLAHDTFEIAASTGAAGNNDHIVALITPAAAGPSAFYCEMFDDTLMSVTMFTYTIDGAAFMHEGVDTWTTARLANGSGTFRYEVSPTATRCTSRWQGELVEAPGTKPAAVTPEQLLIYVENVAVRVRYFVQIRTFD